MPATERGVLCVSIHDVAPATWPDCLRLWQALRAVADIPLTWLVVPRYHARPDGAGGWRGGAHASGYEGAHEDALYEAALAGLLARGHELALHGYTHLDDGAPPRGAGQVWLRRIYTQGEGEFATLDEAAARQRLALGRDWFARRGWPLHGFVAPAWLLGEGSWAALRASALLYTTTWRHFYRLRAPAATLCAPSLVYAARNGAGRLLSRMALPALALAQSGAPLMRLSLHPRDARHPELLLQIQAIVARLLANREALTKAGYARRLPAPAMAG